MYKFFKLLFTSIFTAIVTAIVLLAFLIITFASILSIDSKPVNIKDNTILVLDLNRTIIDRVKDPMINSLLNEISNNQSEIGLNSILEGIDKAVKDKKIKGIYLKCGMPNTGYATLTEIRNALENFKKNGKFIYAYSSDYTQKGYFVSSVANKVFMPPKGTLVFKGLNVENMYFTGALEKLGIEMQIFKCGKYKSAVEPFFRKNMSEAAKEQALTFSTSIWNYVLSKIGESRNISTEKLNEIANKYTMFSANDYLIENNLIDDLWYKDQVIDLLKKESKKEEKDKINKISIDKYIDKEISSDKDDSESEIAVIYASGTIAKGTKDGIDGDEISREIRKARKDKKIKAVVLRVNSPGGSGAESDIIWREVALCKKAKPTVVSMGDLAASGGYYISVAADTILASPTTITGSIGVFGTIPNVKKLVNEKLGITFDGVKTNKYSDFPNVISEMSDEQKEIIQKSIYRFYDTFISRCALGRSMSKDTINKYGQGRVWSGANAKKINLVDKFGGLNAAIKVAANMAKIDDYSILELPKEKNPFEEIFGEMEDYTKSYIGKNFLGIKYNQIMDINNLKQQDYIQARLPYVITIK